MVVGSAKPDIEELKPDIENAFRPDTEKESTDSKSGRVEAMALPLAALDLILPCL